MQLLPGSLIPYIEKAYGVENLGKDEYYAYLRTKAKYDKQFFLDTFLPHRKEHKGKVYKSPEVHLLLDEAYENEEDLVVLRPRGHGKTTRTLVNILHNLIYDKIDLIYISSAGL